MNCQKSIAALLLAMFGLMACSTTDSEEEFLYRTDEFGNRYSPALLSGVVEYMPTMKPESVRIVVADASLNPKDSFEVSPESRERGSFAFSIPEQDYEYPYLKFVLVFPSEKKSKMEFSQYARLRSQDYNVNLQFYGALISGRIETLVQKEKFSFDEAETKAYEELEKELGVSLDGPKYNPFRDRNYWGDPGLYDMLPYVVCRHEISDSAFYSDYKEFRESFAKKGTISESIKARAADAWLSTFKLQSDSTQLYPFESKTRDTSSCLRFIDTTFFEWAYGLDASWANRDSVQIKNKSSEYDGRMLVYEKANITGTREGWRLRTLLEDTIGTCSYSRFELMEWNASAYYCGIARLGWEKLDDIDTIMNLKYYLTCRRDRDSYGFVGSFNDSLYVCSCKSDEACGWSKVKEDYETTEIDSLSVNVMASIRFGVCRDHYNEKQMLDSIMLRCDGNKWRMVDSLSYYMGICDNNSNITDYAKMPNGDYYKCRTFGGKEWERCTPLEANGVPCNSDNRNTYKEYEGRNYYCSNEKWTEVTEE